MELLGCDYLENQYNLQSVNVSSQIGCRCDYLENQYNLQSVYNKKPLYNNP